METKPVTLRLPQEVADYISRKAVGGSVTDGVKNIVTALQRSEHYADAELRGRFTPNEWTFLADTLNGTKVLDDFRYRPEMLVAHNEDSQLYDDSANKWSVDIAELNRKCATLTAAQTEAIYRRVERFWQCPPASIDLWAQY